jgi:hypothetical protein
MFANQGSCSFSQLSVPKAGPSLLLLAVLSNGHLFFFFVGKMKLLLIVFQEFLDERLGGSLHFPQLFHNIHSPSKTNTPGARERTGPSWRLFLHPSMILIHQD